MVENSINHTGDSVKFNEHFIVAEDESGEVVGILGYKKLFHEFSHFATTGRPVDIHDLFVAKINFKTGVGQTLVDAFLEICKKENYSEIVIRSADRWKNSWGFYDKIGFERVGTIPEVNGKFSQVWRKVLK